MKKGILVLLLGLVMSMANSIIADEITEETSITTTSETWSLHNLYLKPTLQAMFPMNDDLDTGLYVGGRLGYEWCPMLSLEAEVGHSELDFSDDIGDVSTIPLLFNAKVTLFPGTYMVDYYLFAGIGVAFNDIDLGATEVDIDNSLAGQIGGGAEYAFNDSISAFLELRFYFTQPSVDVPVLGDDNVDLNSLLVGGGIVWRF